MIDSSEGLKIETFNSGEIPSNIKTVTLPDIQVGDKRIRLGMHTDSVMTLLRTLEDLPDLDKIKIEGRILTPAQESLLLKDPVYNFYLSGRRVRAAGKQEDIFVLPKDIKLNQEKVASLLQTPFTPSVLSEKIGFKVGYFSAKQLIDDYNSTYIANNFLPIIGGINEFKIGSDVLSDEQLTVITEQIKQAFARQERSAPIPSFSQQILNNFQTFNIKSVLLSSQLDINNPGQIKNISGISIGEIYREMHNGQPSFQYKVLADPYQNKDGEWWVQVETIYSSGGSHIGDISLADCGVVPYSFSGKWNPSNSLIKETDGK